MKRKAILFLLLLLGTGNIYAQTLESVMNKVIAEYSAPKPLHYTTTYNLYKNESAKSIHQSYKGSFYKNEAGDIYLKIDNTEMYSSKKINVKISHTEKAVLVAGTQVDFKNDYDVLALFKMYSKGTFKDKKTHWEIELKGKPFSSLPYSRIILYIGKNYQIQKQLFYYNTGMDFSNDYSKPDINYPLLEIVYGKHDRKPLDSTIFNTSKYLTVLKDNKINLSDRLKGYDLIDKRL